MFVYRQTRQPIVFSNHALDRWWERCEANQLNGRKAAMALLRARLTKATWIYRELPGWANVSLYHRARAEGFLALDEDAGFVVNRNAGGDRVAVSYLERLGAQSDAA